MKVIHWRKLEDVERDPDQKRATAGTIPILTRECRKFFWNLYTYVIQLKVFETVPVIISLHRWVLSKQTFTRTMYKPRDIVMVELGLGSGYELSYSHPCIVLYDSNAGFCLVVPCSSGKYGKGNKFIIDGTKIDGFQQNTGVLIDAMRCISKTRIINKLGEVSVLFFKEINDRLVEEYFQVYRHKLDILEKDLKRERQKNTELQMLLTNLQDKEDLVDRCESTMV